MDQRWVRPLFLFGFAGVVSLPAFSAVASKYRQECALTSQEFRDKLPSAMTSVWCADDKRKDFGKMGEDVLHAMAVAAFYEKRMDRRVSAMNLLEQYECTTKTQCAEPHRLLDWGIKSGHPAKYNADLAQRAEALRQKTSAKLEDLSSNE